MDELIAIQKCIIDMQEDTIELLKKKCSNLEEIVGLCDKKVDAIAEVLQAIATAYATSEEEIAYRQALKDFKKLYFEEEK